MWKLPQSGYPRHPESIAATAEITSREQLETYQKQSGFRESNFSNSPTFLRANLDTDAVGCVAVVMTLHKMLQHNGHSISRNSIAGSFPLTTFFL